MILLEWHLLAGKGAFVEGGVSMNFVCEGVRSRRRGLQGQQGRRSRGKHGCLCSQGRGWCVREGSRLRRVQRLALWRRAREGSAA